MCYNIKLEIIPFRENTQEAEQGSQETVVSCGTHLHWDVWMWCRGLRELSASWVDPEIFIEEMEKQKGLSCACEETYAAWLLARGNQRRGNALAG